MKKHFEKNKNCETMLRKLANLNEADSLEKVTLRTFLKKTITKDLLRSFALIRSVKDITDSSDHFLKEKGTKKIVVCSNEKTFDLMGI